MRRSVRVIHTAGAMVLLGVPLGCAHVKVDPIEVKTIHIQHDVTIGVDKALEDFFAFQERSSTQPATAQSTTQPATTEPAGTQPAGAPATESTSLRSDRASVLSGDVQ